MRNCRHFSALARSSAQIDELIMVAILLILFIVLLFAALPIWPYSASGRARYHVSVGEGTTRPAKLPQLSSGETQHAMPEDYSSHFRELQIQLQNALDREAKSSSELRQVDRSRISREQKAA
jgi:Protein of unknown function (DUF3309)